MLKKYQKLNHLFYQLEIDLVSLSKAQNNSVLSDHLCNIPDKIMVSDLFTYTMDNNSNKLIEYRQQDKVFSRVRGSILFLNIYYW